MTELSGPEFRSRLRSCGAEVEAYIMSEDQDLDGRMVVVARLLAGVDEDPHDFLASIRIGGRVFWSGEDGCFEWA